jgi:hypothetical protein
MKTTTKLYVTLELEIPENYGKGNLAALEDLDVKFWAKDAEEPTSTDWAIVQIF